MEDINAKSDDFGQNDWEEKLNSDYWKQPPSWTQVRPKKKGIWDRIKKIPRKIYEFLVVRISYEDYFASQLRSRYIDLQGKFRTNINKSKDETIFEFIKELLILSKRILEKEKLGKMDLISVSSLLDEIEGRMIWIIPNDIKISKIHELKFELSRFNLEIKENYEKLLQKCESICELNQESSNDNEGQNKQLAEGHPYENKCNATIEEIVKAINKDILAKRINTGLQIERLRSLRFWGFILLISFVLMFPMISNVEFWPLYQSIISYGSNIMNSSGLKGYQFFISTIVAWALALSFCVIGGVGGFLSGLLQVRYSETNLELYEEAVLLFQIRPIFGGFTALIIFMLISWGAFENAILKSDPASCVLAAFLSGFSERYFLRLLKTEKEFNGSDETKKKEVT